MAQRRYDPQEIESRWQARWAAENLFRARLRRDAEKYYMLEMLPYPSGRIHMGHVRNYTIGDVAARFKMMQGCSVLHPMGWDAFGMPAENAAIQHGIHPAAWTRENIEYMRGQLMRLGFSYDWEREFATCSPDYYRWEQLIFTRMYERGWAYRRTSSVNWCPACQTVLANEQAEGGVCWRCEAKVELRSMSQWYLRITDYAEELLSDIDAKLGGWPERVRVMQREWIGRSEGAAIDFGIEGGDGSIRIFTTRPDTLYGATFMSLAWDHPLAAELAARHGRSGEMTAFVERASRIEHQARLSGSYEKEGEFTGAHCINPVTGRRMPIYATNFVLMDYGTGAVMAVPAHDQRDFDFARKYGLPVKVVVRPPDGDLDHRTMSCAFEGEGTLVDSGHFSGMNSTQGGKSITQHLAETGIGGPKVTYRLKDWCISRQRYWGTPIPIVYCGACGETAVPEDQLPVLLPQDVELTGEGGSPLAKAESFVNTACPRCGGPARRETDTMDTFVESSWYIFRYACPHFDSAPVDPEAISYWLPVDQYIGGIEHAVGHLIYCRYFTKAMRDLGFLKIDEPVSNLMTQGMVYKDGAKMSKSKGNVVDPDDMIGRYGADTVRLFMLFASPPEKDLEWSDKGIEGASRFVNRLWRLVDSWLEAGGGKSSAAASAEEEKLRHRTIKRVSDDIERYHFNTAIAALMEYVNHLYGSEMASIPKSAIETLILLVSPFVPHLADEMWSRIGREGCTAGERWPECDESKLAAETVTIAVQVAGKLRDRIVVASDATEEEVRRAALESDKVSAAIGGRQPSKVIVVPNRLVNIVL